MTTAELLWSRPDLPADVATVHALVIGVSRYDYLPGGTGPTTTKSLLAGLTQLSAAATAAARVASWLRDNFDYPEVRLGSVRLLASPVESELPLPGGVTPPPATYDEVRRALFAWRADARETPGNITLLYVAGHGIQTSNEGGILLLQDAGHPDYPALDRALDVSSIRRGMVGDPTDPETSTPPVQYYFYDACRVQPPGVMSFDELQAGLTFDVPRGLAPDMSWVLWGSRSRDYALADPETRTTLFSKALLLTLESRAPVDTDGRTVRFGLFQMELETAVDELAAEAEEQQTVVPGGAGPVRTPIYLRPATRPPSPPRAEVPRSPEPTRAVTVRIEGADARGITIRGTDVVVETTTGTAIELDPGSYTVSVDQPWGGAAQVDVDVPEGSTPMDMWLHVAAQQPREMTEAPRPGRLLGPPGGADARWYLRFLSWTPEGLRYRPENTPPAVEVDDTSDDGTVAIILHAHGDVAQYAQLRTADGRSLVVALPINAYAGSARTCWLHVRVSETALGAAVRLQDPAMDTFAGYLTGGRPDHVVQLAPSAEELLMSKMQDPIGATIGGYALLMLNELERVHDWADNLCRWFEWLPDGAVIAAATAGRRADDDHAQELALTAVRRGIPLFSEGLSILGNLVPRLLVDDDLAADARERLLVAAQPVLSLSPMAEFGALTSTLRIDPDPGEVTSDTGWRQFVRAGMPEDPRDFWREP